MRAQVVGRGIPSAAIASGARRSKAHTTKRWPSFRFDTASSSCLKERMIIGHVLVAVVGRSMPSGALVLRSFRPLRPLRPPLGPLGSSRPISSEIESSCPAQSPTATIRQPTENRPSCSACPAWRSRRIRTTPRWSGSSSSSIPRGPGSNCTRKAFWEGPGVPSSRSKMIRVIDSDCCTGFDRCIGSECIRCSDCCHGCECIRCSDCARSDCADCIHNSDCPHSGSGRAQCEPIWSRQRDSGTNPLPAVPTPRR